MRRIASFLFSRCPSICPLLMKSMKRIEDAYRERGIAGTRLVSITWTRDEVYNRAEQVLREAGARL